MQLNLRGRTHGVSTGQQKFSLALTSVGWINDSVYSDLRPPCGTGSKDLGWRGIFVLDLNHVGSIMGNCSLRTLSFGTGLKDDVN